MQRMIQHRAENIQVFDWGNAQDGTTLTLEDIYRAREMLDLQVAPVFFTTFMSREQMEELYNFATCRLEPKTDADVWKEKW